MRRLHEESGFTLIELLIFGAIAAVVATAAIGAMVTVSSSVAVNNGRNDDLGQARVAMTAMAKTLRTAVPLPGGPSASPFVELGSSRVIFYAYANAQRDTGPKKIEFEAGTDGKVTERMWDPQPKAPGAPTFTYPSTPTRERVLTGNLENPTDVFTAHCSRTQPLQLCADPTAAAAGAVAVSLRLQVRQPGHASPSDLTTRVRVANLDLH